MNFSVLISVYDKEDPEHLRIALESIWSKQTLRPTEIVLVKDGILTPELDKVIDHFNSIAPLKICKLDENHGLGYALAFGLNVCSNELIARMDSDDISGSERFEKQVRLMTDHPELDISGTNIAEFHNCMDKVCSHRRLPSQFSEIQNFARRRNPLNHMTVILRKDAVLTSGNYVTIHGYEDYYLWVRMLNDKIKIVNLPEIMVYARIKDIYAKRRGIKLFIIEFELQKKILQIGFINKLNFISNIFFRALPRLLPAGCLKLVYKYIRN